MAGRQLISMFGFNRIDKGGMPMRVVVSFLQFCR